MDAHRRGQRYLEHLTAADREFLVRTSGQAISVTDLRRRPDVVETLLAAPATYRAVFEPSGAREDRLVGLSPFLAFAVAIHRSHAELAELAYVQEWTGPRQRVPVFVTDELRSFTEDPDHRLFLAELLTSYTRVVGGTITVRRHGVIHRQRFSDLDLTSLAALLSLVADESRAGLYRRLGDLALLLTGVFPDHTAAQRFAPIEVERLARALDGSDVSGGRERLLDALATRGAVGLLEQLGQQWYRLALERASVPTMSVQVLASVGDHFVDARRVLNHLTDQHLFPFRARWFPAAS